MFFLSGKYFSDKTIANKKKKASLGAPRTPMASKNKALFSFSNGKSPQNNFKGYFFFFLKFFKVNIPFGRGFPTVPVRFDILVFNSMPICFHLLPTSGLDG